MKGPIENSKEWWEERYQEKASRYGKEPSTFLANNLKYLRKGKVLDLGMGEGRNSVYLAQKGFEVTGVDFAPTALGRAEKLAADTGVKVDIQSKDVDMFLLPLMTYDSVVIVNYKPNLRFLKDINRGLQQGGVILIDAYTVEHIRKGCSPTVEMFEAYGANEVLHNLKNVHISFYQERQDDEGRFKVQAIARKTGLVG